MALTIPSPFLPLHKYLQERYAGTVVLGLTQIEDLMGSLLPDAAHTHAAWWGNDGGASSATPYARSWTQAGRTASPHLRAGNVTFERI